MATAKRRGTKAADAFELRMTTHHSSLFSRVIAQTKLALGALGLALAACNDAPARPALASTAACSRMVDAMIAYTSRCTFAPYRYYRPEDRSCLVDDCTTAAARAGTQGPELSELCRGALEDGPCLARGPVACMEIPPTTADAPARRHLGEHCGDDSPECDRGLACDGTKCVLPQVAGGECVGDDGCLGDLACERGICEARRRLGDPCRAGWPPPRSDCELEALCDPDTQRCVLYDRAADPDARNMPTCNSAP